MARAPVCTTSVHLDRASKFSLKGKPGAIIGLDLDDKITACDKDVNSATAFTKVRVRALLWIRRG